MTFNANFQMMINKLFCLSKKPPINLQLAIYLHKIEITYLNFVFAQKSSAQIKIPELSTVMAKLENQSRQVRATKFTTLFSLLKISNKRA